MVISKRAVFLDRDGVVNKACVTNGKPFPPINLEEVEVLPGVKEAVELLQAHKFAIIVVTNQPDVANKKTTLENVYRINEYLKSETGIEEFYICPHNDLDFCECRKPKPGLLKSAAEKNGINLEKSFMVGDRWRDIEAGQKAGCKTFFIDNKYEEKSPKPPYIKVSSVLEATHFILEEMS